MTSFIPLIPARGAGGAGIRAKSLRSNGPVEEEDLMNDPLPKSPECEVAEQPYAVQHPHLTTGIGEQIRPMLVSVPLLTLLFGILFPLILGVIAKPLFPHQAKGSLVTRAGFVVGSDLIGQQFASARYFHSRPSAAGDGYDATQSGGTNLGPANPKLLNGTKPDSAGGKSFAGVGELAQRYRQTNGLKMDAVIPVDALTRSGSGLDPHISPANALLQVPRVAQERNLSEQTVRQLVMEHTQGRQFGFLGEPRVAVLPLNVALDQRAPRSAPPSR